MARFRRSQPRCASSDLIVSLAAGCETPYAFAPLEKLPWCATSQNNSRSRRFMDFTPTLSVDEIIWCDKYRNCRCGIISSIRNDRQRREPLFPQFFGDLQAVTAMTVQLFGKTRVQKVTIVSEMSAAGALRAIKRVCEVHAEPRRRQTLRSHRLQNPIIKDEERLEH